MKLSEALATNFEFIGSLIAINDKWLGELRLAYLLVREYHAEINRQATLEEDSREFKRSMNKSEDLYDRFCAVYDDLPKRERANLQRFHKTVHGYEA